MSFEHEIHQRTFERVEEYLGELFEDPYHDPETDHFYVRYGSTVLEVSVDAYGPEEAVVTVMAYCVRGIARQDGIATGLLELNHDLALGAFSMVGDDIFFSHSILGREIEPRDLLGTVAAVATVADDYDDRIVEAYGGQTALERIRDTGGRRLRGQGADESDELVG